jgi:hypothetical protein
MFQSFTVEVYAMSGKGDPQQGRGGFEPFGALRIVRKGPKRRSEPSGASQSVLKGVGKG